MTPPAAVVSVLAMGCFASFSWAVGAHFHRDKRLPLGMQLISFASVLGFGWIAMLILTEPPSLIWPLSPVMLVAALALFWWTVLITRQQRPGLAFAGELPDFLNTSGPYRYVRHPFYASYILFWLAISLTIAGIAHWLVPAVLTVAYFVAARCEEQDFAVSPLAEAYADYRQRTGMLMPLAVWTKYRPLWLRGVAGQF